MEPQPLGAVFPGASPFVGRKRSDSRRPVRIRRVLQVVLVLHHFAPFRYLRTRLNVGFKDSDVSVHE